MRTPSKEFSSLFYIGELIKIDEVY
ncbi:MAG: Unknown protein, partial [uncultured Sulfurovum sp.]